MNTIEALRGKTLLIVEDEEELREPLAMNFESLGCDVFQASNGVQGFDIVSKHAIDLVISDIRMPGGNGIEMLKRIKERSHDMPVVMLITGFSDVSFEETYAMGAEAILSKPFDLDEIEDAIMRLLTPPEMRWSQPADPSRLAQQIERSYRSLAEARANGELEIGRGGIFLARADEKTGLNPGNRVGFLVRFDSGELLSLEGAGVVRWARPQDSQGYRAGCGIEFESLSDGARAEILALLRQLRPPAFLPRIPS